MRRSTGAAVTATPYRSQATNQRYTFRFQDWWKNLKCGLFSVMTRTSSYLPQHIQSGNTSAQTRNTHAPPSQQVLHLLACVHQTQSRKILIQDRIEGLVNDRALFCFLKTKLAQSRSRMRSLLSMRKVKGIYFNKVRIRVQLTEVPANVSPVSPTQRWHSRSSPSRPLLHIVES